MSGSREALMQLESTLADLLETYAEMRSEYLRNARDDHRQALEIEIAAFRTAARLTRHHRDDDAVLGVPTWRLHEWAVREREISARLDEFRVIPCSEIHGTQYGIRYTTQWGESVAVQADKAQALQRAPELAAQYPNLTIDAVERPVPPWSVMSPTSGSVVPDREGGHRMNRDRIQQAVDRMAKRLGPDALQPVDDPGFEAEQAAMLAAAERFEPEAPAGDDGIRGALARTIVRTVMCQGQEYIALRAVDAILAEFLVISRSDVVGTEYGWRNSLSDQVCPRGERDWALLTARKRGGEAVERPRLPWSVIPLPEDGQS